MGKNDNRAAIKLEPAAMWMAWSILNIIGNKIGIFIAISWRKTVLIELRQTHNWPNSKGEQNFVVEFLITYLIVYSTPTSNIKFLQIVFFPSFMFPG